MADQLIAITDRERAQRNQDEADKWRHQFMASDSECERLSRRVEELESLFDAAQELAHAVINAPWSSRQCDQALDRYMLAAEAAAQSAIFPLLLAEVERLRGVAEAARAVHDSRVRGAVNLRAFATVGSIELGALGGRLAELDGLGYD
jgi:hypothetical protein